MTSLATLLDVLRAAGFRVLDQDGPYVALRRGARSLQVPKDPESLRARWSSVLASAGMDQDTFQTLAADLETLVSQLPSSSRFPVAAMRVDADE